MSYQNIEEVIENVRKRFIEIKNTNTRTTITERTRGSHGMNFVKSVEVNDVKILFLSLEELLESVKELLQVSGNEEVYAQDEIRELVGEISRFYSAVSSAPNDGITGRVLMDRGSNGSPCFPRRRFHSGR